MDNNCGCSGSLLFAASTYVICNYIHNKTINKYRKNDNSCDSDVDDGNNPILNIDKLLINNETDIYSNINSNSNNTPLNLTGNPSLIRQQLLDNIDVFLFDCDGVLWKGDSLVEGAKEEIE